MKLFMFLTFLVAFTTAEWTLISHDEWLKAWENCNNQFSLPFDLRPKTLQDKYPPKIVFENVLCYFKGLEIWNDKDGFLVDRIMIGLENVAKKIENYNAKLLREGLKSCTDQNSEKCSTLDAAYSCFKCFIDNKYLYESMGKADFYKNDE
ncbi:uncharacterized protein LOC129916319 [Episyrphus balteatus]|uniref:uncharacterized protein LOC129916319 n=1 Tax=Episyrphus balteatus TaxID=286459 RepID=UPI002485A270|nr:uncharacterized protein LOC129916319 [Episyrphus balteatus]